MCLLFLVIESNVYQNWLKKHDMDGEDKHSFVKTGKQEKGVTTWETMNSSKIVRYKGNIQNNN